ncbi:hypothetical protein CMV_020452 [Castanea mollissima]|uniref:Uncharacterized protein n=1 Tax=Castanea mollissima TaxID=60419 RepID=A0A8J4QQN8_9ROSI|nr:hypothetical protein CMV_020452 [Castanea mollissima]
MDVGMDTKAYLTELTVLIDEDTRCWKLKSNPALCWTAPPPGTHKYDEEPKKPTLKKWDLIKAFGCCNCSTT